MNCHFCNTYVTNGQIVNGKILCQSCQQKMSAFTTQQNPSTYTSNRRKGINYEKCPKCGFQTMEVNSTEQKFYSTKSYNCHHCKYYYAYTDDDI